MKLNRSINLRKSNIINEASPNYVDYKGEQRRLYQLSKSNKNTGEKKTRYFVKDKDYEPLTPTSDDLNADLPNRAIFTAYKQFKTLYNPEDPDTEKYKGLLFPLFVGAKEKDGIKPGVWYKCGTGELRIEVDETGKPIPGGAIQVDSKLGNLAYRPGWHLASAPVTRHIGVGGSRAKDNRNNYDSMYSENVWSKVEYSAHYDYTDKAKTMPGADKDPKKAMFTDKNEINNGFYHYKTNSNADDSEDWLIADAIRVVSILSDETVKRLASEHGLKAQNRWQADGTNGNKFIVDFNQYEVVESMNNTNIKNESVEDVPYTYKEVLAEIKSITSNFTDKNGTLKCFYRKEKEFAKQILEKHYETVEASDASVKADNRWTVIAYHTPIKTGLSGESADIKDEDMRTIDGHRIKWQFNPEKAELKNKNIK